MIKNIVLGVLAVTFILTANTGHAVSIEETDAQYLEAERSYLHSDVSGSLKILADYFKHNPNELKERTLAKAHNLKGLILFQQKNLSDALQEFERAVQLSTRTGNAADGFIHLTRYNYANALYQSNRIHEAHEVLQSLDPNALDIDTRTRFFHLLGNVSLSQESYLQATMNYLNAANLSKEPGSVTTYIAKAYTASRKIYTSNAKADIEAMEKLTAALPKDSEVALSAQMILASGYLYLGNGAKTDALLKDFLAKAGAKHPLFTKATELLEEIQKLGEVRGDTIGLLLPLSGKFARFGRLCMNSAFMALHVYEEMPDTGAKSALKFAIRDSGDTPESALAALEKLVLEDHVVAVVGPLLSKQFPLVAQKAQELGAPLISLSQRIDSEKLGSYIFPIALSPNQQIEMIVSHAIEKLGYKRFAILAPSDNFGEQYVQLFWDAVEARGGAITGIERYEPKSTDFRDEMKRLLGQDYMEARTIEQAEIHRRRDAYASTLKVRGKLRERLLRTYAPKPIVDFDAVFIPDDPQTVGQIAPSFAVEGVDNLPMLGINTWNTSEIIQRAGRYLQHSLFVDAYFSGAQDPSSIQFQSDFFKYFQSQPGTIEVQAYDAVSILKQAIETAGGPIATSSRAKLRDQLISQGHFHGVSGDFFFSDAGVKRSAHLLTIRGNSIAEM